MSSDGHDDPRFNHIPVHIPDLKSRFPLVQEVEPVLRTFYAKYCSVVSAGIIRVPEFCTISS